jgi:hypothetical protein
LRSLADFAKIVGVLDARNASFVSVTQYQDYSGDHKNRTYAAVLPHDWKEQRRFLGFAA